MTNFDVDYGLREFEAQYQNFLDDNKTIGSYNNLVKEMISKKERRLIVNINDLRDASAKRCDGLLSNAYEELPAFQRALKNFVAAIDATYAKDFNEFFIGLKGSFGPQHVTPRTLTSSHLGHIMCVEGIVTKCSLVRPKIVRSVHYCPSTKRTLERHYTDITSFEAFPSTSVYPTKDENGNLLETEFGLSVYKDHQTFSIQEMPEKAPVGQLPRAVDIVVDDDLVDCCKPGDRVQVIGTFRCLPSKKSGYTSGTFRTILLANNVQLISKEMCPDVSGEDVSRCKKFSKQNKNVFELLSRSLAPSIHGNEYIKKAVLCLLLGGVEKILPNGTRLRGDINILLLGDPSVAKSQILRYVLLTAPCAIPTTGRGSSGVGLTAAVTTDQETGDRRLEAGAMVLADRGVVCIDEFDKMSDIDRTAIHEVMEQGRVTIAKAGIHAKLNARCSVLAAANPVYGKYDQYKTPMKNIGMQDSLLSRFDLLFIMLDKMDPESDKKVADHVVRMHRYRTPGEADGKALAVDTAADFLTTSDSDKTAMKKSIPTYEKFNSLLHGSRSKASKVLSVQFMKMYINIAKGLKPVLTKEACEYISQEYTRIRSLEMGNSDIARTQPVTVRSLETLIRIGTAHAKARMSKTVDLQDAELAVELVEFALFKKVATRAKKRHHSEDEWTVEDHDINAQQRKKARKALKSKTKHPIDGKDPYAFDEDDDDDDDDDNDEDVNHDSSRMEHPTSEPVAEVPDSVDTASTTTLSEERLKEFKSLVLQLFKEHYVQSVPLSELTNFLIEHQKINPFTSEEIDAALKNMMDANQVMVANDFVFLI